jgi:hypothetical protein
MSGRRSLAALAAVTGAAGLTLALLDATVGRTQDERGVRVAISDNTGDHVHSVALQATDVAKALADLNADDDTITIISSSGILGGFEVGGVSHTDQVELTKRDLQRVAGGETVRVESLEAAGHTHMFEFLRDADCPAVLVPIVPSSPTPSPSISVSPSVSPSPSPSASPTGSPSVSPSVSPSASPTTSPSPSSPTPRPTRTFTLPTFTPPGGIPTARIPDLAQ